MAAVEMATLARRIARPPTPLGTSRRDRAGRRHCATATRARQRRVQMLYQWEVGQTPVDEVIKTYWRLGDERATGEDPRRFRVSTPTRGRLRPRWRPASPRTSPRSIRSSRDAAKNWRVDAHGGARPADPAARRLRVPRTARDAARASSSTRRSSWPSSSPATRPAASSTACSTPSARRIDDQPDARSGPSHRNDDRGIRSDSDSAAPTSSRARASSASTRTRAVRAHRHGRRDWSSAHGERTREELEAEQRRDRDAGRILGIRSFGKANFLVISDGRSRIQVYVRQDSLPERDFTIFKLLDFGDFVGVEGHLFRTKTNELTIWASRLEFLAKCFVPLPEKWHGLSDVEIRYRQRYLDLIVNPDSRRVFEVRSRVLAAIREFLDAPRLPRGRDADDAADRRRRAGAAVRDASQRARHAAVPAHRARAVSEAADGRRHRARLRDQPQLPERGDLDAAQPRVHDARVLPGLQRLPAT